MNLSFSCSLRLGELLGLTWDCVDVSEEAMLRNRASIFINKELQRVRKDSMKALGNKDIIAVFPESTQKNSTALVLKKQKNAQQHSQGISAPNGSGNAHQAQRRGGRHAACAW